MSLFYINIIGKQVMNQAQYRWLVSRLMSVLMKWDGTLGREGDGVKGDSSSCPSKPGCDQPNSPEASSAYLGTALASTFQKLHLPLSRTQTLGEAHPG